MPKGKMYKKTKGKKAPNGNKIQVDRKDKSGLSLREFKQIKKMLPKVEIKMGPVQNFGFYYAPYQFSSALPNIPIIGKSTAASVGLVEGVDWIKLGPTSGTRIGNKIYPKRITCDLQFSIDEDKSDTDLLACPYQIRWWVLRVKGTNNAPGEAGLDSGENSNWDAFFDCGNDDYRPPIGNVTDMYNKVNRNLYTVYKEGMFDLLPIFQKKQVGPSTYQNAMVPSLNSKIFKHIHLDLTKYVAKTLKYNDDSLYGGMYGCSNDALYITFNVIRYDNYPITPSGQMYVNCTSVVKMDYTDT